MTRLFFTALIAVQLIVVTTSTGVGDTEEKTSPSLKIVNVSTDRLSFRPSGGERVDIIYRLSEPAVVDVRIYDCRNLLIRHLVKGKKRSGGDQREVWNGRDEADLPVPPEVYTYTIKATDKKGRTITYDITDLTGGEQQWAEDIQYDPEKNEIHYVLPKAGRVNVRLGIQEGPLLSTLIDWPVREAGQHVESWDGTCSSGELNFGENPKLDIAVWSYNLSGNSIVVLGDKKENQPRFIDDLTWGRTDREETHKKPRQLFNHWRHPREACRDPKIYLKPIDVEHQKDGIPIIDGETYFQMTIDPQDHKIMIDQKFEVVFYVDGLFVYEEELGYTPFSWRWDPTGVNDGFHHISVVLRGYQGHFGSATKKVWVRRIKE